MMPRMQVLAPPESFRGPRSYDGGLMLILTSYIPFRMRTALSRARGRGLVANYRHGARTKEAFELRKLIIPPVPQVSFPKSDASFGFP
jgi:hypothetical protein